MSELNLPKNKLRYDAFYYSNDLDCESFVSLDLQMADRAVFKVFEYPDCREGYLVCDSYSTDGYSVSNFENPFYAREKDRAYENLIIRTIKNDSEETAVENLKTLDSKQAKRWLADVENRVSDDIYFKFLRVSEGLSKPEQEMPSINYVTGIDEVQIQKNVDDDKFSVVTVRDGEKQKAFETSDVAVGFFAKNVNTAIMINKMALSAAKRRKQEEQQTNEEVTYEENASLHR